MNDMERIADLLLPRVRGLEIEILKPVYPDVYTNLDLIEDNLVVIVQTSEDPLLIQGYTILFKSEVEDGTWKDVVVQRIKDKFKLLAAWKNGETMQ